MKRHCAFVFGKFSTAKPSSRFDFLRLALAALACAGIVFATPSPVPMTTSLVFGYDETLPQSTWTRPGLYDSYDDPAYGTSVTRISSADGTRFNRNTYSRRQAENADGSRFMTYHGTASYRIYNQADGTLVRTLDIHPDAEPQWHPTNPELVRHIGGPNSAVGDLRLREVNVETGGSTVVANLTTRLGDIFPGALYLKDRAEGSPSADGSRYAWLVYNTAEDVIGLISYDLSTDTILGTLAVSDFPDAGPIDALSMSPTGDYVVTQQSNATFVFNDDMTNRRLLFAGAEHSDIALNTDGRDAYVYIDFTSGPNAGWLMSIDLDTLGEKRVFNIYRDNLTSLHVSGKGYDKPGWVIVSTYNCRQVAWTCDKVMAVELLPNGRVLNLAHTYNCGDNYWTETHAVPNRDVTRVYFNTDSGSCGIDAEVMRIDVPPFS